ncbi:MAG: hypothetical protein Q4D15_04520 [Lachnospiraceae bacterium]|nr:hypothetical protein [Lachnospiraceae bacterium]
MSEIENAASEKISKIPASYRKAMFRAELAKMDTKELLELKKIYSELIARHQAKRPPSKTKALTERLHERVSIYPASTRIGALIRDSDLAAAKSYVRALCK